MIYDYCSTKFESKEFPNDFKEIHNQLVICFRQISKEKDEEEIQPSANTLKEDNKEKNEKEVKVRKIEEECMEVKKKQKKPLIEVLNEDKNENYR